VVLFVVLHLAGAFGPGARTELRVLTELSDDRLATVPPAGEMRFADGQRTLAQVVLSLLKHQRHQCDAIAAALPRS